MEILGKVKTGLRLKEIDEAMREELEDLIEAAKLDLGIAGVENVDITDPLIIRAIVTFCKFSFGLPEDYDRLKASYDEQKAQLQTATGYTDWGEPE